MGDAANHVRYFCDKLQLVSLLGRAEGTFGKAFIPSRVMLHLGTTSLLGQDGRGGSPPRMALWAHIPAGAERCPALGKVRGDTNLRERRVVWS